MMIDLTPPESFKLAALRAQFCDVRTAIEASTKAALAKGICASSSIDWAQRQIAADDYGRLNEMARLLSVVECSQH